MALPILKNIYETTAWLVPWPVLAQHIVNAENKVIISRRSFPDVVVAVDKRFKSERIVWATLRSRRKIRKSVAANVQVGGAGQNRTGE
jgi:hypothetical protein